jgi:hypothetical protein
VPIGTSIRVVCSGPACPFSSKNYKVTRTTTCRGMRCRKRSTSRPNARDIDLTPALNGARLPIGTVLTVTFRKPFTIGQLETITIGPTGPTFRKGCIPVGKNHVARHC